MASDITADLGNNSTIPLPKGQRGRFKDLMTSFEGWLAKLELSMGESKDQFEAMEESIGKLESLEDELHRDMQLALNSAIDMLRERDEILERKNFALKAQVVELQKDIEAKVASLIRALEEL